MSLETDSSAVESKEVAAPEATPNTPAPEASTETTDVKNSAESSDAGEGVKEKAPSMLDAVKQALKKPDATASKEDGAESPPGSKAEGKESDSSKPGEKAETEEPPPFAKHPRWQEKLRKERALVKETKALREEVDKTKQELDRVTAENAAHKQIVDQFAAFQGAVRSAGLQPREIDDGFNIMRMMKSDPAAALQRLMPYVEALQSFVGQRLPADLQSKVDNGIVDEETARQLAATRSRASWLEQQGRKTREQQAREAQAAREREQQQAVRKAHDDAASAVTAREMEWKNSDPDYSKKQPLVEAEVARLLQVGGFPRSSKEAVALFDKARSTIEERLAAIIPRKTEVRTVTGGASAKSVQPRPTSLRDAIANAARGA